MYEVLKGIRAKLTAAALSGVSNKIWLDKAPTGTAYPYIVITNVSSIRPNQDSATLDKELWQVSIFTDDLATAVTLQAAADTALHNATLSITGQTALMCWVVGQFHKTEDDNDKRIYHAGLELRIWANKTS
jgi:hypothetical protein